MKENLEVPAWRQKYSSDFLAEGVEDGGEDEREGTAADGDVEGERLKMTTRREIKDDSHREIEVEMLFSENHEIISKLSVGQIL